MKKNLLEKVSQCRKKNEIGGNRKTPENLKGDRLEIFFERRTKKLKGGTIWSRSELYVTASSGTAISTDFATLTCSEILSKILIRCVTWH